MGLVPQEIIDEVAATKVAPRPQTLAELWALPLVPLDDFLELTGVAMSSYYTLRAKNQAFPVVKFGRKVFVRPAEVADWFAKRPGETGAAAPS